MKHQLYPRSSAAANGGSVVHSAFSLLLALLSICLLCALQLSAQSISSGTLVGTVTDPSGAEIPGAQVTLTEISTNNTRVTTTNADGHFVIANVTPANYNIRITKDGFQTALVSDQKVEIGKTLTENVKLPIGQVATEVTVETTGAELQTNATVGDTVSGIALQSLPSVSRDASTFVTLQPGVSPDGSVAGTAVDQSSFQLDGGQNSNDMDGSSSVYLPSFVSVGSGNSIANQGAGVAAGPTGVMPTPADSIEEFKVNTANQTSDFNSSSGAQVQMVTKHGTNTYHGTLYDYYLDNNFNANTWQNNHTTNAAGASAPTPLPSYHYNRFGASLGGTLLPKMLGGKTYFFANYEGFRWPNVYTVERAVPTASMRLGLLNFGGTYYNLNPTPVTYNGVTYASSGLDPRGLGLNPLVSQVWSKYMPLPNENQCALSRCDTNPATGLGNVGGFRANMALPQNSDFGVIRIDHDFGERWKFNATYHYYNELRASTAQVDIGGFFPGDTLGVPSSTSNRPQKPWMATGALTTVISSNTTNDFHYSFLRNYWAYNTQGGTPQLPGLGAALEPFGESQTSALIPYNVDTQNTRERYWDGLDNYFRDDVSKLHGNHLFQFGGAYQRNRDKHSRTDNGGGINYQPVYQLGITTGSGITGVPVPAGLSTSKGVNFGRDYAAALGIVSVSQQAFTRSGADLTLNPPLVPATDDSTIPYYNIYFSDSWHIKPTVTFTYGLGWTLEMPPTEAQGKQVEFVDQSNNPIEVTSYLRSREQAALAGQVFNPMVGFSLLGNTAGHPSYIYNPYYKEFSPRVALAWNPHGSSDNWMGKLLGGDSTVVRAGYGRIYGRLNGVDLVLVPLLGTGLIQAVQCPGPVAGGGPTTPCDGTSTPATAFRIGTDGLNAPLGAPPSTTLPQPYFPGIGGNATTAAGEALDPNFRPNVVDSFTFSIQRQLSQKVTMEIGYIGRLIGNEYLPINVNAVPHMMTLGGQPFDKAYAAVEQQTAFGNNIPATVTAGGVKTVPGVTPQPFFEAALAGTGYCTGYSSCTAAVVDNENSNFASQSVWSLWSDLDNGGTAPGFNFPHSMMNTAGQITAGVGVNASVGYGNYNAGYATVKMSSWHGVTMQQNFTWSKALGTGAVVQATSQQTPVDPFNLDAMYGLQAFDRKFVYNAFVVYQPPFYLNQQGLLGRVLGGWTFSPLFTYGSGSPLTVNTVNGGGQAFGEGDSLNFFAFGNSENAIQTSSAGLSTSRHNNVAGSNGIGTNGTSNMFADPAAVFNNDFRQPIVGLDTSDGGFGIVRGMPYWNLDLSIRKTLRVRERFNVEGQIVFTNVLNHMQFYDPSLDTSNPAAFGVLNTQGNTPRQMEFGLRVAF